MEIFNFHIINANCYVLIYKSILKDGFKTVIWTQQIVIPYVNNLY